MCIVTWKLSPKLSRFFFCFFFVRENLDRWSAANRRALTAHKHCLDHCTWTTAHGQLCLSIILQNNTWQNQGGEGGNRVNAEQGGESVNTDDSQRSFRVIYAEINVWCLPPVRNLSLSIGVHLSVLFLFLNLSLFLSCPFPADGPVSWFFSRYSSKSFC